MKTYKFMLIVCIFIFLLSACAGGNQVGEDNLEGETWVLINLNGNVPLDGQLPTIQFEAGQVSGNASCNHYGGSYQIEGEAIHFNDLFSTEMDCLEPDGVMEQEQVYLELLRVTNRSELIDGKLTFFTDQQPILVFTNQPDSTSVRPTTPTLSPEVIAPTPIPTFEPPAGYQEYQDQAAGVSLFIPESWMVTGVVTGQSAIFQSYPLDKYIGGEGFEAGDTKCDLISRPKGSRADDLIQQWRSDSMTTIVSEEELVLQSGLIGKRFVLDSMGRANVFIAELNQKTVLLTCFGDFTLVDTIAATLIISE